MELLRRRSFSLVCGITARVTRRFENAATFTASAPAVADSHRHEMPVGFRSAGILPALLTFVGARKNAGKMPALRKASPSSRLTEDVAERPDPNASILQ
jgi:hypothetical protein